MDEIQIQRLLELAEKGVEALERLAQDPVIEIEAAPPICPHCGKFNPNVSVDEGTDGPIADCVIPVTCGDCGQSFYAMPITWHMHPTLSSVRLELEERAELISNGNKG